MRTKRKTLQQGLTLVELIIVVNLVAILAGVATVTYSGRRGEAKCLEIQSVIPQIVSSQTFHLMQSHQYYSADHEDLRSHGVDLSDVKYFTYATFPDEDGVFFVRAEATGWAPGGWVLYKHGDDDPWDCDGEVVQRIWLPGYKDKKVPPGQAKK